MLRSLIDLAVELGKNLVITFIHLEKAFDTISHAHLEEALFAAGASVKSVAMFSSVQFIQKPGAKPESQAQTGDG